MTQAEFTDHACEAVERLRNAAAQLKEVTPEMRSAILFANNFLSNIAALPISDTPTEGRAAART